jgi:TPR repeat protein
MKKLLRLTLFIAILFVVGVGLLLLRNYQMEAGVRAYKDENGVTALNKLKPLAYLGDKTAQMIVGSIYAYGSKGVPKNDDDAIYWFRRCGPIGSPVEDGVDRAAAHELSVAKAYMNGSEGVKADPVEGQKWLQLAAKGGSKEAADMLAESRPKKP